MNDLERVVSMKNIKHALLAILVLAVTPVALAKVEIENRSTQNVEELGVEQIAKSMELGNKLVVEDVENGVAISGNVDFLPAIKGGDSYHSLLTTSVGSCC